MSKIALVVNSCFGFYGKTIPILLKSCERAGIPPECIFIVIGESPHSSIHIIDGIHLIFTNTYNIDYNAAIFIISEKGRELLYPFTHFFYLHDTCEVLENFWENLQTVQTDSFVKLLPTHSKNIGFINKDWFVINRTSVMEMLRNEDPEMRMKYKEGNIPNDKEIREKHPDLRQESLNEDSLFSSGTFDPFGVYHSGTYFKNFSTESRIVTDLYGTGQPRMETTYPFPGIKKYQANWGQSQVWTLDL